MLQLEAVIQEATTKQVILGVGVPASGKTTILKPLAEELSLTYINADDVRLELTGDAKDHSKEILVWETVYKRLKEALQSEGAILDATHVKRKDRRTVIAYCREHGAQHIKAIWLRVSLDTSLARNKDRDRNVPETVIARMHNRLELNPPELSEGFDEIEIIET